MKGRVALARGRQANPATAAFGGASFGATILVRGVPNWLEAAMQSLPLGSSVDTPLGATVLAMGVSHWSEAAMRTLPLRAFGGAPLGRDPREGARRTGQRPPCEPCY
eukprot:6191774-Pyramimonas_sp.AAC.1